MSKELDIKLLICPDCGSDDLQLYAMEEHLKPTHSVCNDCEREEKISSLEKKNAILMEAVKIGSIYKVSNIPKVDFICLRDILREALEKIAKLDNAPVSVEE